MQFTGAEMYKYTIPSLAAYHKRTLFHSNERNQFEANVDWYHRILEALHGCDYGELAEFIAIDKFISGLDYEAFRKYAERTTLTIDDLRSIGLNGGDCCKIDYGFTSELDNTQNVAREILTDVEIKLEDVDDSSCADLDRGSQAIVSDEKFNCANADVVPKVDEIPGSHRFVESKLPVKGAVTDGFGSNNDDDMHEILNSKIKGFQRDQSKKIVCLDCGKCFKHKNSYNCHKRIHTGTNLFYCNVCGKRFVKESQLKVHLPTHDQDKFSVLECYLCASKFDRVHGLRIHFTISHTTRTKRNLPCPMCSRTFSKQNDLDLHIKVHRGVVKGHSCPHCDKIFDRNSGLKEHLVVHLNTKEFVCETCGRAFKTKNMLKKHAHSHNVDRRFKCCECGHVLKSTATLKNHMRQHTGERPYTCDLCGKSFITCPSLTKHLRVHRQEKPAQCTVCSKRFATLYHLKVHTVVHTKAKPYSCKQCDRAFTQLGTLKAHQLKAHTIT